MERLELHFADKSSPAATQQCLDVPDITTALVVADIVAGGACAEIRQGDRLVAKITKLAGHGVPSWQVN